MEKDVFLIPRNSFNELMKLDCRDEMKRLYKKSKYLSDKHFPLSACPPTLMPFSGRRGFRLTSGILEGGTSLSFLDRQVPLYGIPLFQNYY
jgi:hypothetical protein